mmetsp:Transcript_22674/g.33147  ORF Transcript_22674/g.33147 Transcript_22674/m.33147 type:complete len:115 (+) Transcript_22674:82-426(+)
MIMDWTIPMTTVTFEDLASLRIQSGSWVTGTTSPTEMSCATMTKRMDDPAQQNNTTQDDNRKGEKRICEYEMNFRQRHFYGSCSTFTRKHTSTQHSQSDLQPGNPQRTCQKINM